ncbi:hypothetical protein ILYODFUR_001951 [Ilyodon furcidens]|uniref:Uncharacterized protein n=1 Tax=Ilyodon furcidens TaxID=33524 RepID=A0ABV0UZJ4_9TELE
MPSSQVVHRVLTGGLRVVCGQWVHSRSASAAGVLIHVHSFFTTWLQHYGGDNKEHAAAAGVHRILGPRSSD